MIAKLQQSKLINPSLCLCDELIVPVVSLRGEACAQQLIQSLWNRCCWNCCLHRCLHYCLHCCLMMSESPQKCRNRSSQWCLTAQQHCMIWYSHPVEQHLLPLTYQRPLHPVCSVHSGRLHCRICCASLPQTWVGMRRGGDQHLF